VKRSAFIAPLLGVLAASTAHASGGYYSGTKGARPGGRGGAFTAKADDLTAVTFNPAGLVHEKGTLLQFSNRFSYNSYEYTRAPTLDWGSPSDPPPQVSFATVENETAGQAVDPLLGVATDFGLRDWRFALVAFAPAGTSRLTFPLDGGQKYQMVSREAIILNYSATAAWRLKDILGIGASFQWIHVPRLWYSLVIDGTIAEGQAHPVSASYDMHATTKGASAFTPNAVLGAWYRPVPFLEIGLAGQVIPASVTTKSTLAIDPVNSDAFNVALSRNGQPADDVTVNLPLPLSARAGFRYMHLDGTREVFDVELDVAYESWSRVERFRLDSKGLQGDLVRVSDGMGIGAIDVGVINIEKQWQDTVSVHLGSDVAVLPGRFTVRGGFFYESPVATEPYASVDFVGGKILGGTFGGSLLFGRFEFGLSYEYRHQLPIHVSEEEGKVYQQVPGSSCAPPYTDPMTCHPAYQGQPSPTVNAGTYRAHSNYASIDVLYRF